MAAACQVWYPTSIVTAVLYPQRRLLLRAPVISDSRVARAGGHPAWLGGLRHSREGRWQAMLRTTLWIKSEMVLGHGKISSMQLIYMPRVLFMLWTTLYSLLSLLRLSNTTVRIPILRIKPCAKNPLTLVIFVTVARAG